MDNFHRYDQIKNKKSSEQRNKLNLLTEDIFFGASKPGKYQFNDRIK